MSGKCPRDWLRLMKKQKEPHRLVAIITMWSNNQIPMHPINTIIPALVTYSPNCH